jgi:hypothetical protein
MRKKRRLCEGSRTSRTRSAKAPKNMEMFMAFCPFQVTGAPVMSPWSLPKAMRLPVKVRKPKNTSNPRAPMVNRSSVPAWDRWRYSETPTRAAARPPKAWERAIRSGILVIGIHTDMAAPIAEPMISPRAIHRKVRISLNRSVATTASSMPKEPRRLPFRA